MKANAPILLAALGIVIVLYALAERFVPAGETAIYTYDYAV